MMILKPEYFFPKWASILDQLSLIQVDRKSSAFIDELNQITKNKQENNLDIMDMKMCIVGETYGFTNKYENECEICRNFAAGGLSSFPNFYNNIREGEIKDWRNNEIIQEYLNHIIIHKHLF